MHKAMARPACTPGGSSRRWRWFRPLSSAVARVSTPAMVGDSGVG